MKVYLRKIPSTEYETGLCDITKFVKKINLKSDNLNTGESDFRLTDYTIEFVNDKNVFSEIKKGTFFPDGNAYKTPIYIVDEETNVIIDAGIVKKVEELIDKGTCIITVGQPLSLLNNNVVLNYTNITPPDLIIRILEELDIDVLFINNASFETAKSYYEGINFSIDINITDENKNNGFNVINEILDLTGDSVFLHNNVIYYYLNNSYSGKGGFPIYEKDLINNIKIYRMDGSKIITKIRYKISDTTQYTRKINDIYPGWEYLMTLYKEKEHYKDYSTAKFKINTTEETFTKIADALLSKKGDRKLIIEITVPIKYNFLKIGQIVNLTLSSRGLFYEPFEITGKTSNYNKKLLKLKCRDLNLYPILINNLSFCPPEKVENFTVWAVGTHVYLNWLPVTKDLNGNEIDINHYKVYYGIFPSNYDSYYIQHIGTSPVKIQSEINTFDIAGCPNGYTLYFNITAVSDNDIESSFTIERSIEISETNGFGITPYGDDYGN